MRLLLLDQNKYSGLFIKLQCLLFTSSAICKSRVNHNLASQASFFTVGIAAQCFGMNALFDAAYKQPQVPGIEVMPTAPRFVPMTLCFPNSKLNGEE